MEVDECHDNIIETYLLTKNQGGKKKYTRKNKGVNNMIIKSVKKSIFKVPRAYRCTKNRSVEKSHF